MWCRSCGRLLWAVSSQHLRRPPMMTRYDGVRKHWAGIFIMSQDQLTPSTLQLSTRLWPLLFSPLTILPSTDDLISLDVTVPGNVSGCKADCFLHVCSYATINRTV